MEVVGDVGGVGFFVLLEVLEDEVFEFLFGYFLLFGCELLEFLSDGFSDEFVCVGVDS